jgi:hypothetical protein
MMIRREQMQVIGRSMNRPLIVPCQPDWIEIRLIDQWGEPVPNETYELTLPDGSIMTGKLNNEGTIRVDKVLSGNCEVKFPDLAPDDAPPGAAGDH